MPRRAESKHRSFQPGKLLGQTKFNSLAYMGLSRAIATASRPSFSNVQGILALGGASVTMLPGIGQHGPPLGRTRLTKRIMKWQNRNP